MTEEQVEEWLKRGKHDFETAKFLFEEDKYFEIILYHLQQGVEKYLKGLLISKGWKLRKIHNLETLLTEAMDHDAQFERYLDLGRELTAFYFEERYPPEPLPEYSDEEVKKLIDGARELIKFIKDKM